jgi:hypothetical protein
MREHITMKAIFTGLAAFAVVLAVQPAAPVQKQPRATADQIEAAVDSAQAEAGAGVD